MELNEIKLIKENDIKLKARHYYHKYGYAIAELVLNDTIRAVDPNNKSMLNRYKSILKRIVDKNLL